MSRLLTIGDIHGCCNAFRSLLAVVRPTPDDLIITLGDYIDRGPDSRGVLDELIRLHVNYRVVSLLGNHEEMMMTARQSPTHLGHWLCCGGLAAIESYGRTATLEDVPAEHWRFLEETCVEFWELKTHFFVHAFALPEFDLDKQPPGVIRWLPLDAKAKPHSNRKVMVCGHTEQRSGLPLDLGHIVCVDTWAYGRGWLSCIDFVSGQVWQANQKCETRAFRIDTLRKGLLP